MKTLAQQVKQAFNALEFTNATNLSTLTTMLNEPDEPGAQPAAAERHQKTAEHDLGLGVTPPHSHSY